VNPIWDAMPESIKGPALAAIEAADDKDKVQTAVLLALPMIKFDAMITSPDWQVDGREEIDLGWSRGLSEHDRMLVTGFIAQVEGAIADAINSLAYTTLTPEEDPGVGSDPQPGAG
jgi:hypothetical protein